MKNHGITQFLIEHAGLEPVSFHMPGHKGRDLYGQYGYREFLDKLIACDITEIHGADNLFQTEGIIKETGEKYRKLYDVRKSYLLINGTSGGLIAGVLASVPVGGKLIMARNCHKSVFNAIALGGIEPVYAYPEIIEEYGISGAVSPAEIEKLIDENPEAGAVILPSPNYYGICSDISEIAKVVHRAGKILIVDQAHGAHLKLFGLYREAADCNGRQSGGCKSGEDLKLEMPLPGEALKLEMPLPAEEQGADIVVNSIHKTLLSFTQSALLNVNSDRVDLLTLEDKLQMIESTSPSYLLMASLDINADILGDHGRELMTDWMNNLRWFYGEAALVPGLRLMKVPSLMDATKINIDMSAYGIDGGALEEILLKEGIFAELVTGNILMCMTGIGNCREDYQKLLDALKRVALEKTADLSERLDRLSVQDDSDSGRLSCGGLLWGKRRTLHSMPAHKVLVKLPDAEGRICASSIIPYPPGIPFICPGEEIGRDEIEYIRTLREKGEKVIGVSREGLIEVGEK